MADEGRGQVREELSEAEAIRAALEWTGMRTEEGKLVFKDMVTRNLYKYSTEGRGRTVLVQLDRHVPLFPVLLPFATDRYHHDFVSE